MRLLDDEADLPLNRVWVYLTEPEARTLADQLFEYFEEEQEGPAKWHAHVESDDGRPKELTVALYDPTAPGDHRWQDWYQNDRWTPGMFTEPSMGEP